MHQHSSLSRSISKFFNESLHCSQILVYKTLKEEIKLLTARCVQTISYSIQTLRYKFQKPFDVFSTQVNNYPTSSFYIKSCKMVKALLEKGELNEIENLDLIQ